MLGGLGQEYKPVVVTITSKTGEITMQEAQFLLMSFEARLEEFASFVKLPNALANMHMKTQRGDTTNF